jgi:hypothetical protein
MRKLRGVELASKDRGELKSLAMIEAISRRDMIVVKYFTYRVRTLDCFTVPGT